MIDFYRVIDIQIYKNSQWITLHKTFYDINVINRVYSIIKNQRLGEDIRILDSNNKIIDPSEIFNKVKRNKHFGLKIKNDFY